MITETQYSQCMSNKELRPDKERLRRGDLGIALNAVFRLSVK